MTDEKLKLAEERSGRIHKILHGLGPDVQGAVLADLVSMWLAGHIVLAENGRVNRQVTDNVRAMQAENWFDTVLKLVPLSENEIIEKLQQRPRA